MKKRHKNTKSTRSIRKIKNETDDIRNSKEIFLSDYLEDEKLPLEFFTQKFVTEMEPFNEAIEVYKSNLLYVMMDLISTEIMRLTAAQREVIIRYFFNSESIRMIAKCLNKDLSSVRDLKSRALKTLRRRLSENPYFMQLFKEYQEGDPKLSILIEIEKFLEKNV